MLALDSGLWSGFQRQMELAESFGQPIITVRTQLLNVEILVNSLDDATWRCIWDPYRH